MQNKKNPQGKVTIKLKDAYPLLEKQAKAQNRKINEQVVYIVRKHFGLTQEDC